jgi:hypothetical protein
VTARLLDANALMALGWEGHERRLLTLDLGLANLLATDAERGADIEVLR